MRRKESKDLLVRIKKRYQVMQDADRENRIAAMDDLKFVNVPGQQWDENMKQERGNRPCYEFNKLRVSGKRIINDIRANRPHAKIRPVEGGDKEVAEINEGLCRNIWARSDGDTITDYAAEFQVNGGMAAWRVTTEYADDSAFEQDILIEPIQNPFCLFVDPAARDFMKRDAEDWILTEKMSYKAYEARWPKAEKHSFEADAHDEDDDWEDEETVRVAEYWYKVPHKKEIWQLDDGTVVDSETDEANGIEKGRIKNKREVQTSKIMWCIASGERILEGPTEWAGRQFPFVMVFGEYIYVDGRPYWWGLPRFAKDAQRSYNVARTAISETIAQAPKNQWWATAKQAEGLTDQWARAHKENFPFLLYNSDQQAPGAPQRMGGADVPVALMQESAIASDEIKAVTGIFDASMGNEGNETSGRAIYARQQQGEIATFNYRDNMAKGVQRTYEILLDLIPQVYDTERELRVLGTDGADDYVRVNQIVFDPESGKTVRINDLAAGRYDVAITVGPSFATQRQEAAETYMQLTQGMPEIMGVAGDLVFKSMDLPYAEEIAERLQTLLPPQIQQTLNEGAELPPEAVQAMQQAEQAMAMVQEYGQVVQAAAQELESEKSEVERGKAETKAELANIRAAMSDLKAAKAEFDAHIARESAGLIQKEAGITVKQADMTCAESERTRKALEQGDIEVDDVKYRELIERAEAVDSIDQVLATFMEQVGGVLNRLNEKQQELQAKAERQVVGGTVKRVNGRLVAEADYSDGSHRSVAAVREKGGLKIVNPDAGDNGGSNSP